jgi:hypothetical protein
MSSNFGKSEKMKNTRMSAICAAGLGVVLCALVVSRAAPMGTAFTYQGHLYDNNDVANG